MKTLLTLFCSLLFVAQLTSQVNTNHPESSIRFSVKAPATPFDSEVSNQHKGGTCWCMSALSFWEAEGLRLSGKQVNLSERFVIFHVYLMKAHNFLERDGKAQFGQGGEFLDVQAVVRRFGLMPETAWPWEPAPAIEKLHPKLESYLKVVLQYHDLMGYYPDNWEADFHILLERALGKMPTSFQYEGKEHTPRTFAQALKINAEDYVNIMSDSRYPLHTNVVLPMADNWISGTALNVSFNEFTALPQQILRQGGTIEWATDVSNPHWKWKMGIAVVHDQDTLALSVEQKQALWLNPVNELSIDSTTRQVGLQNHSTTDDHGMHIVALVENQLAQPYYLVKNSWGTESNACMGYLFVSAQYFNKYTTMMSIHKDFLPPSLRK